MKSIVYFLLQIYVKIALYCYYSRIGVVGKNNLFDKKSCLILGNHQNALLDPLLIAVFSGKSPWFLTRSDVFKNAFLKNLFNFLKMIPIYRMRDGKANLSKNEAVFNTAAEVLANGDSLMMFPEANHNLKRKVRPLSKGFTRVVFRTLELYPKTSLHLAPVGFNYQKASHFPDRVAIYFGETIDVTSILEKPQSQENVNRLKNAVFESLKTLTVHIDDDANYEGITNGLEAIDTDYTHPLQVNEMIVSGNWKNHCSPPVKKHKSNLLAYLFYAANFPYLLLWWGLFKKKVPEIEFTDTFRFMYMLLFYPLYYLITVGIISTFWDMNFSLLFMVSHMLFNFLYVKLAPYVT